MDIVLKSVEFTVDNANPVSDNKNIMFFNGYLKGYEAAQKDYKQLVPSDPYKDPASIYF